MDRSSVHGALTPQAAHSARSKLAMHVNEVLCAGSLVQRIDVLGDGEHIAVLALEPGKGEMGGVGPRLFVPGAAEIVEIVDADRIAGEAFRRRHVLDPEVLPQPASPAKSAEPALGRQPCPGQHDDVVIALHGGRQLSLAGLAAVAEVMIGEHDGHHRLADRHGADADARIVTALGRDFGLVACGVDGAARGEDR